MGKDPAGNSGRKNHRENPAESTGNATKRNKNATQQKRNATHHNKTTNQPTKPTNQQKKPPDQTTPPQGTGSENPDRPTNQASKEGMGWIEPNRTSFSAFRFPTFPLSASRFPPLPFIHSFIPIKVHTREGCRGKSVVMNENVTASQPSDYCTPPTTFE